jgi:hypothetical protein
MVSFMIPGLGSHKSLTLGFLPLTYAAFIQPSYIQVWQEESPPYLLSGQLLPAMLFVSFNGTSGVTLWPFRHLLPMDLSETLLTLA